MFPGQKMREKPFYLTYWAKESTRNFEKPQAFHR